MEGWTCSGRSRWQTVGMVLRADAAGDEHGGATIVRPIEVPLLASRSAIRLLTQLIFAVDVSQPRSFVFSACHAFVRGSRILKKLAWLE